MSLKRTTIYVFWEDWKKFLEICEREGDSGSNKIRDWVRTYNLENSPGNPQMLLSRFVEPKKKCFRCNGFFPSLNKVEFISGLIATECAGCLKVDRERGIVKKDLGLV